MRLDIGRWATVPSRLNPHGASHPCPLDIHDDAALAIALQALNIMLGAVHCSLPLIYLLESPNGRSFSPLYCYLIANTLFATLLAFFLHSSTAELRHM